MDISYEEDSDSLRKIIKKKVTDKIVSNMFCLKSKKSNDPDISYIQGAIEALSSISVDLFGITAEDLRKIVQERFEKGKING